MNRAERRREARERRTPGPNTYNPAEKPHRDNALDPDKPGRHVWIATSVHRVSEAGAYRAMEPGGQVLLDKESVVDIMIGCYACERVIQDIPRGEPCPGEPVAAAVKRPSASS